LSFVQANFRNGFPGSGEMESPRGRLPVFSQDTRTLKPGNLYVAIHGDHFDGHDFIPQAFEQGAVGALSL